jgi:hypothetical protein
MPRVPRQVVQILTKARSGRLVAREPCLSKAGNKTDGKCLISGPRGEPTCRETTRQRKPEKWGADAARCCRLIP